MTIFKTFHNDFISKIREIHSELNSNSLEIQINTDSKRIEFGDISTNAPLILAKIVKKNPAVIAEIIIKKFEDDENIKKIEFAGMGFINIFFKNQVYQNYYQSLLKKEILIINKLHSKKKYNVEFVSANPTGPLHIGHGRGAIIGDVLSKVLKIKGYEASTEFYINDAGNQIERLGKSVQSAYLSHCNIKNKTPENGYKGYYIEEITEEIVKKEKNNKIDSAVNWFSDYAKNILLKKIKKTLLDYQVTFDMWFSEKTLHESLAIDNAIVLLTEKGFTYETDDKTLWFKSTLFGDDKDRVLKKQDGQWTYIAADIAYFLNKINRGFDHIVMILGQDHHSFKIRLEAIAKAFNFDISNLTIILYQLITLKNDGELMRMSKRKGNSIELETIIDTVGSDVARFFYLNKKADAHLDFDIKEALEKSNANPVFYIQYAMVRIKSIFEKVNGIISDTEIINNEDEYEFTDLEKLLLKKISLFDKTLEKIITLSQPHLLTYYTTELVALFHSFYTSHPIISPEVAITKKRLGLLKIIYETLNYCVNILRISIPDKM